MKKIGIWIDKEKAYLITNEGSKESIKTIVSGIENYHVKGGSTSKTSWGPQDVVHDSKYLEREKHQFRNYFKEITNHLKEAEAIVIFGPAETYLKLLKELKSTYKDIAAHVICTERADSMTENQMKALVRDYFNKES